MHIHDKAVIDEPTDSGTTAADICALMNELPEWAGAYRLMQPGTNATSIRKIS